MRTITCVRCWRCIIEIVKDNVLRLQILFCLDLNSKSSAILHTIELTGITISQKELV